MGNAMRSLIHELDNDALLLLYVADELAPEDLADVEQQLGVDAVLRAELAIVRAGTSAATAALDAVEALDPPVGISASAETVALRRVGRVLRQRQVERLARNRPVAPPQKQPRFPSWAYPAAAAAVLLMATLAWRGWERHSNRHGPSDEGYANNVDPSFGTQRQGLAFVGDAFGVGGPASTPELADAEQEANRLRHDVDASDVPSILGGGVAN